MERIAKEQRNQRDAATDAEDEDDVSYAEEDGDETAVERICQQGSANSVGAAGATPNVHFLSKSKSGATPGNAAGQAGAVAPAEAAFPTEGTARGDELAYDWSRPKEGDAPRGAQVPEAVEAPDEEERMGIDSFDGAGSEAATYEAERAHSSATSSASPSSSAPAEPPSPTPHRLLHEALEGSPKSSAQPLLRAVRPPPPAPPACPDAATCAPTDEETLFRVFSRQLRAAADVTARLATKQSLPSLTIHKAQAMITVEAFDAIATLLQHEDVLRLAL